MNAQPVPIRISFADRAEQGLKYDIPIIPVEPHQKKTLIGTSAATTDRAIIAGWNATNTDYNAGLVAQAKPGGVWILDCDSPEVAQQFKKDTGMTFPQTLTVQSSKAGHRYFRQNDASLKRLKNLSVTRDGKEFFSVRWNEQYCVGPLSNHPDGGVYTTVIDREPTESPDYVLDWLLKQYQEQARATPDVDDGGPILEGNRNTRLFSIGCKLRAAGLNYEEIESALLRINADRCKPPYESEGVKVIAGQAAKYNVGADDTCLIGGVVAGTKTTVTPAPAEIKTVPYPVFPRWAMKGTSIYEGLVKPVCEKNSRYPEFMFMPAMALLLNYIGLRVRVEYSSLIPSWMMVVIGKRGETIKSSSVESAVKYFQDMGLATYGGGSLRNAEGRMVIYQAGSPEGLGVDMVRTNCQHAVLFYDELSVLVNKAGIEGSSLAQALLTIYESGNFSNLIKGGKQSYTIQPGTYCASLLACCPTKSFTELWAQLSSQRVGLDDRFFFLLEPETLIPLTKAIAVSTTEGAVRTRKLIDRAVEKGVYRIASTLQFDNRIQRLGNRPTIRGEKLALGFAIDLERDEIDDECVERALAIIDYEQQVKQYLGTCAADTRIAAAQIKLRLKLERSANGRMDLRELKREMNASRYGSEGWFRIYGGLLKAGTISEEGSGSNGDAKMVQLLEIIERDD